MLIPTSSKAKLPKFLSYPVGAELLTQALANSSQLDRLRVAFLRGGAYMKDRHTRPYPILLAEYKHFYPNLSSSTWSFESGDYDEKWQIYIYGVSNELRSKIRGLLLNEVIPKIEQWLSKPRLPTHREGRENITVYYDESSETLKFVERN